MNKNFSKLLAIVLVLITALQFSGFGLAATAPLQSRNYTYSALSDNTYQRSFNREICWHSDSDCVFRWTTSPKLFFSNISIMHDFSSFSAGFINGISKWNTIAGLTVSRTYSAPSAQIMFYGGAAHELIDLGQDWLTAVDPYVLGYTEYVNPTLTDTVIIYNGKTKMVGILSAARGYIVYKPKLNYSDAQYIKTCTHELGHAVGWYGHPKSYQPNWVMQQGYSSVITPSMDEKDHLEQAYALSL